MREYQKPYFEKIRYSEEEILTTSGGLIVEERPSDDDKDWGNLFG